MKEKSKVEKKIMKVIILIEEINKEHYFHIWNGKFFLIKEVQIPNLINYFSLGKLVYKE